MKRKRDCMKKIISLFCSFVLCISLFGCSNQPSSIALKKNVSFELLDVIKIKNNESNSIYYYYMAQISNESKKDYNTTMLSYSLSDDKEEVVNAIDKYSSTPNPVISKGESTYIYGYIGFPNNNQNDLGFYFPKLKEFLSFSSIKVREMDNSQIKKDGSKKFTLFEDNSMAIKVNAKKAKSEFSNGNITLSNIKLTYENKTKNRIVVPYLEPKGILNGLDLKKYSDKGDFSSMSLEDFKKIDFTNNGLSPKTENIEADATGYVVYYLEPEQSIECNISFTFENAGIDYSDKDTDVFTVKLISSSFGSTTTFDISY